MTNDTTGIDDKALSSLSVAPDGKESEASTPARGDAGRGGDLGSHFGTPPPPTGQVPSVRVTDRCRRG